MKIEHPAAAELAPNERLAVIYDGQCPFCASYVGLLRLREALHDQVQLIDARQAPEIVVRLRGLGIDLDNEMVLAMGGSFYSGADCLHMLALLTSSAGAFNRFNAWIFSHPGLARRLYPAMRFGRNCTLSLMGRKRIDGKSIFDAKRRPGALWRGHKLAVLVAMIVPAYVLASHSHRLMVSTRMQPEIFPFFNWSLFSRPVRQVAFWTIDYVLPGVNGGEPQVLSFENSALQNDTRVTKTVVRFSRLFPMRDQKPELFFDSKQAVDRYVRSVGAQEYFLVRHEFDPLERMREGRSIRRERIARFLVDQERPS